uniref:Progestin and adipoQ receptor family member VII, a n=2 Tax=Lepisosteus oculatus TaxID=7918 RepID=W5NP21_LEPOC
IATTVMEKIGRLFINLQQVQQVPQMLKEAAPSLPCTMREGEVPCYLRERYIHTGYRQMHQGWRYYFLSLFQRHNETVNVWSHLLSTLVVLMKLSQLAETVDFVGDVHAWPLLILLLSSLAYMMCSTLAHLLSAKSEFCHYAFFFLDYVGVALYQYGSALVHFYYAIEGSWHSLLQGMFMPCAAFLSWFSCLACCYSKYWSHNLPYWHRKVVQVVPSGLAYAWDISPVVHRIFSCHPCSQDPAVFFHVGQVAFFLSSAFFFTQPLPQKWFPGRCDVLGQGHQLFHVLLALCTLSQIEASRLDYLGRRPLYQRLHGDAAALHFSLLFVFTGAVSALTAVVMSGKVRSSLDHRDKLK